MRRLLGLGAVTAAVLVMSAVGMVSAASGSVEASDSEGGPEDVLMSPPRMLEEARAVLVKTERATQATTESLRASRQASDIVKSLCLDDKLAQLEVARSTVEERVQSLEGAVESGNSEGISHDFSVISALGDRVGGLTKEADQCIGEDRAAQGSGSILQVHFDPAIPNGDTSSLPLGPNISTPPVAASATF